MKYSMAKTIVWSESAKIDLIAIKAFFDNRNKSSIYSTKLLKTIRNSARLIEKYPDAGIDTNIVGLQGLIAGNYILFFRHKENYILILTVWDSRRNPEQLESILRR
ncbi:type II toxin-antitoxin system RelE/ParE family toxin [Mucilaginibacter arboris]|uniref:Type II toxin-antitoxin system RelE/ParE family toxin n=1 Tax=Mucilaginibacter arboris TaxID=2682090 RepID=A0A7K1SSH2_9SPHI|nr:type II toxin-antitoxin system RelE/ParE family toxin [Mucilaginibacter arboris]MVN20251.1 type II toxin-antitoxin system RelE/ParE family toxin [Mucilaginibacter arboris]